MTAKYNTGAQYNHQVYLAGRNYGMAPCYYRRWLMDEMILDQQIAWDGIMYLLAFGDTHYSEVA